MACYCVTVTLKVLYMTKSRPTYISLFLFKVMFTATLL